MEKEIRLFPDIRLVCGDIPDIKDDALVIYCCLNGICECRMNDGYYYLTSGSYLVCSCSTERLLSCSADYSGITLIIDPRYSAAAFAELLELPDILKNMQRSERCIFSADDNIQKLIETIYKEADTSGTPILRIKALELLMLIGGKKNENSDKKGRIGNIGSFICENLCEHYTIAQLSELFEIDPTTLKTLFRQNFGCPVYTYAKSRKMFRAAELLRDTDMKVIDIAEEVGYCNASKFSGAFRDVMGTAPRDFQTEHKKRQKHKDLSVSAQIAY